MNIAATVLRKSYSSAFVLDRPKFSRIVAIMEERLQDVPPHPTEPPIRYDLIFTNGKTSTLFSSNDVLSLDNSVKNPIRELLCYSYTPDEANNTRLSMRFQSDPEENLGIVVSFANTKWANQAFAELEEQLERTMESRWLLGANKFKKEYVVPVASLVLMLILLLLMIAAARLPDTRFPSQADRAELLPLLTDATTDSAKLAALVAVRKRMLRDTTATGARPTVFRSLATWRSFFVALPLIILLATIYYISSRCYPWAAFVWGDYEQHHAKLLTRRKNLWSVVVVALLVGILTNLFAASLPALR